MMSSLETGAAEWSADPECRNFLRPIAAERAECEGVGKFALWVTFALLLLLAASSVRAQPKGKKTLTVKT